MSAGARLLGIGAGSGGPAAWVAKRFGVRPILLEPLPAGSRAAARLFGLPVVTADGRQIPLRTESVDVAWCLGVLCTIDDKAAVLREVHRVLVPGASFGLLVVVAGDRQVAAPPDGNHFPTQDELDACARMHTDTGFALIEQIEQIERPSAVPFS